MNTISEHEHFRRTGGSVKVSKVPNLRFLRDLLLIPNSLSCRRFALAALLFAASALSAHIADAQQISLNGMINNDSSNGHHHGRRGKPKPTPTPGVDGESNWNGTTSSDFNTAANWTPGGGTPGSAPPVPGDVAWLTATPSNKTINLSSNTGGTGSLAGFYFNGTAASGYTITSSSSSIAFTLTGTATTIGSETGDVSAVAIGAENTSGTNTISAPIILAPSSGSISTIFQASGGTLTLSGVISGSAALSKSGSGTLILSGANTYSGGTYVNSGTVNFQNDSSFGTGTITLGTSGGGSATITNDTTNRTLSNNIIVSAGSGGTLTLGSSGNDNFSGFLEYSGNIALNGDLTANPVDTSSTTVFSGVISGSGSLTKVGLGDLRLTNANTFTGQTNLGAGDGSITLLNANALQDSTLNYTGGTLTFYVNIPAFTFGGLTGTANLTLMNNSGFNQGIALSVGNNNSSTSYSGVLSGTGSLTKIGTGTLTLAGANTYTGTTTVNAGALLIDGSLAAGSAVTVSNSGSVLGGAGTINGSVAVNSGAILQGGDGSIGQSLTLKGPVTMGSGSIIQLALSSSASSTLTVGTGGSLSLQSNQQFAFIDLGAVTSHTYTLGTGMTQSTLDTSGFTINQTYDPGWAGTFSYSSGTLSLSLSEVPEPGTYFASGLAFAALLITQRRRLTRLLKHT